MASVFLRLFFIIRTRIRKERVAIAGTALRSEPASPRIARSARCGTAGRRTGVPSRVANKTDNVVGDRGEP